jgi:holliday junction DNA helicase RuvB
MGDPLIQSTFAKTDLPFENVLRPRELDAFVGQAAVRERLQILLDASRAREEPLSHCLFCGPPGLGKTTLAHIMARSMGTQLVVTSGPVIEKAGDLAGLLTNLKTGDILFIDEIHRLSRNVEEYLYPAMEDYVLDLMIDAGPSARSVQVKLNRFTLIGATTRSGLLSAPLRSRFGFTTRLHYYEPRELQAIVSRSAELLEISMDAEAAHVIAERSRGTPRIANNLIRWVRDYAHSRSLSHVDCTIALQALEMLAIDANGLEEMDRKILQVLVEYYQGGPVGLKTLSVAVGEESDSLEEVYEPFLVLQGYLKRTPRGRVATSKAWALFGATMQPPHE